MKILQNAPFFLNYRNSKQFDTHSALNLTLTKMNKVYVPTSHNFQSLVTDCIEAKIDESLPALARVDNDGSSSQEVLLLARCQTDWRIWLKGLSTGCRQNDMVTARRGGKQFRCRWFH